MISSPVDLDDRLRAVEERIRELTAQIEPLLDIRAAAEPGATDDVEARLAQVRVLAKLMQGREGVRELDATDQLMVRLLLRTLTEVAVQFRRQLHEGSALLTAGRKRVEEARRALVSLEHELTADTLGHEH